jgi:alpha-mannosidase
MTDQPCELNLETDLPAAGFYLSNVLEAEGELLENDGAAAALKLQLGGHEITTVGLRLN